MYQNRLRDIKLVVLDIDGVLASEQVIMMDEPAPIRTMSSRDVIGLQLAAKSSVQVAIITGGSSKPILERLSDLGVHPIKSGVKNKEQALEEMVAEVGVQLDHVLYMGDDLPDYYAMNKCGIKICPANSANEIKAIADYVTTRSGGNGAVREVLEQLLKERDEWFKPE